VEFAECETLACRGWRPAGLSYPRMARAGGSSLGGRHRRARNGVVERDLWDCAAVGRGSRSHCSPKQMAFAGRGKLPTQDRDSATEGRWMALVEVGAAAAAVG